MTGINTLELQRLAGADPPCAPVIGIDLAIEAGEAVALLGPTGSGKASLVRLIAGFGHQTGGRIRFNGHDLAGVPAYRRPFTLVTEHDALFPHMTVAKNVAYGLKEIPPAHAASRVGSALARLGVDGLENASPKDLDPRQRQLVSLARALAVEPAVLLMSGCLDRLHPPGAMRTLARVRSLQRTSGMTLVIATSDGQSAMATAGRIVVMRDGAIVETGNPASLYSTPRSAFAAEMTGPANLVPADLVRHQEGAVACPLPAGTPWAALLRPDMIRLHVNRPEGDLPMLEGRVAGLSWSGAGMNVLVRVPGMHQPLKIRISGRDPDAGDLPEGRRVWSRWDRGAATAVTVDKGQHPRGMR